MSNLRIVYDNAADRASSIVASSTAGTLVASNLLTDTKSEVWRSTGNEATLTLEWATAEFVSVVALPFCSLSSAATIRVEGYLVSTDATPAVDTGDQFACAAAPFGEFGWGMVPLGVNAYSYGGGTYGAVWFETNPLQKIVITVKDTTNPLGYIEASRLVTGTYWSPVLNAEYGVNLTVVDTTRMERSDAGDLKSDRGTQHKRLSFDLSLMPTADRNSLWSIFRGNGMFKPVFCSLIPEADDATDEQIYQIYGKVSKSSAINYQFINQFNSQLELEEV